ncbi:MAG TPA: hypothetical protein VKA87_01775 [Nitrososphaeraceae archaeon]|jgi:hypothetical protein|nr:hypothetical protein [Nitrososphaeraceae archaeon]
MVFSTRSSFYLICYEQTNSRPYHSLIAGVHLADNATNVDGLGSVKMLQSTLHKIGEDKAMQ